MNSHEGQKERQRLTGIEREFLVEWVFWLENGASQLWSIKSNNKRESFQRHVENIHL